MFGPVTNPANEHLPDLNAREHATLIPLVILAFWIGIYPKPLFRVLERPVQLIVEQVNPGYYAAEHAASPAVNAAPAPSAVPALMSMPGMDMSPASAAGTEKK
jgi:NADH-quinone oxidoreductase subunit M